MTKARKEYERLFDALCFVISYEKTEVAQTRKTQTADLQQIAIHNLLVDKELAVWNKVERILTDVKVELAAAINTEDYNRRLRRLNKEA